MSHGGGSDVHPPDDDSIRGVVYSRDGKFEYYSLPPVSARSLGGAFMSDRTFDIDVGGQEQPLTGTIPLPMAGLAASQPFATIAGGKSDIDRAAAYRARVSGPATALAEICDEARREGLVVNPLIGPNTFGQIVHLRTEVVKPLP
jgi:hypothetical protein